MTGDILPTVQGRPPVHVVVEVTISLMSDGRLSYRGPVDLFQALGLLEEGKDVARKVIREHQRAGIQVAPAGLAQALKG